MDGGGERVAILFTDIEGSTRRWAEHPDAMAHDLARHDEIVRAGVVEHGGTVFSTGGDGFGVAFADPQAAVAAAACVQRALVGARWSVPGGVRVRMGLHVGKGRPRGGDWFGPDVNTAARVMAAGHGGQVVASADVADQVRLEGLSWRALGPHHLRDVPRPVELHQLVGDGLPDGFDALRTEDDRPSTLPRRRTALVGAAPAVADLRTRLARGPLVTVVGHGGAGKTRLAVEAAAQEEPWWPGGTYFVDLAPVEDPARVGDAFVIGTGTLVVGDDPPLDQVAATLGDRAALVVVDNCEHLLDAAAAAVDALLDACPEVAVLATSRAPLEVPGEQVLTMPLLAAERPDDPGPALFVERARATGAAVDLAAEGNDVVDLCRLLGGLPLAIELAAARRRSQPTARLIEHLRRAPGALGGSGRGRPERQMSLRATIEWSYRLLGAEEQRALRLLSICRDPFTARAAAAVLDREPFEAENLLDALVAQSLVEVDAPGVSPGNDGIDGDRPADAAPPGGADELRYRLLVPTRAVAADLRADDPESEPAHERLAAHLLAVLAEIPFGRAMNVDLWSSLRRIEHDLLAVPEVATDADGRLDDLLGRSASNAIAFLADTGSVEQVERWAELIEARVDDPVHRGEAAFRLAYLGIVHWDEERFATNVAVAQDLLPDDHALAPGARCLGAVIQQTTDPARALEAIESARALGPASLRPVNEAVVDYFEAGTLVTLPDPEGALEVYDRVWTSLVAFEPTTLFCFWAATQGAMCATMLRRPTEALARVDRVAHLAPHTDWGVELALARAAALSLEGDPDAARRSLRGDTDRYLRSEWPFQRSTLLAGFGMAAAAEGRHDRAVELLRRVGMCRSSASTTLALWQLGELEGWPPERFGERRAEVLLAALARDPEGHEHEHEVSRLLAEEVARTPE